MVEPDPAKHVGVLADSWHVAISEQAILDGLRENLGNGLTAIGDLEG